MTKRNHPREFQNPVYYSAVFRCHAFLHFWAWVIIIYFSYLHVKGSFLTYSRVFLKHSVYRGNNVDHKTVSVITSMLTENLFLYFEYLSVKISVICLIQKHSLCVESVWTSFRPLFFSPVRRGAVINRVEPCSHCYLHNFVFRYAILLHARLSQLPVALVLRQDAGSE
jgi:hypothetical protein